MITGTTKIVAHLGYPTESFKAPLIYNPWFEAHGVDAIVAPFGITAEDYASLLRPLFKIDNLLGALVTMPHKLTTANLVDELSVRAKIAGSVNAILRRADGSLLGDMFDGVGFVRGMERKGRTIAGARALIAGAGGVGSAIAASLAEAGVAALGLYDVAPAAVDALCSRLGAHYPELEVLKGSSDPSGYDIVVDATPLGMKPNDPPPIDASRIAPAAFVGEVVMTEQFTPFLRSALAKGCEVQVGTDMLYEMIPAYLEFFGFGGSSPAELRKLSQIKLSV